LTAVLVTASRSASFRKVRPLGEIIKAMECSKFL
jgi:hypothetical protein